MAENSGALPPAPAPDAKRRRLLSEDAPADSAAPADEMIDMRPPTYEAVQHTTFIMDLSGTTEQAHGKKVRAKAKVPRARGSYKGRKNRPKAPAARMQAQSKSEVDQALDAILEHERLKRIERESTRQDPLDAVHLAQPEELTIYQEAIDASRVDENGELLPVESDNVVTAADLSEMHRVLYRKRAAASLSYIPAVRIHEVASKCLGAWAGNPPEQVVAVRGHAPQTSLLADHLESLVADRSPFVLGELEPIAAELGWRLSHDRIECEDCAALLVYTDLFVLVLRYSAADPSVLLGFSFVEG